MRGFRRTPAGGAGGSGEDWLPRCASMAVGSVPFADPEEAFGLFTRTTPEVFAWPQFPRRSFLENMYVQFAAGLPGLRVDQEAGLLWVENQPPVEELMSFVEAVEADDLDDFSIGAEYAVGLHALPAMLQRLAEQPPVVKGQVTGPVSFCLSTTFADKRALLYDDTMREAATEMLAARARWQELFLRRLAPASTILMMVDEPFLAQWGSGYISMPDDLVAPPLTRVLTAVDCLRGIHVCGGTDWGKVVDLPLDLLNFDAADHAGALLAYAGPVGSFLREGGLLAWGAIPNDDRAGSLEAQTVGGRVLDLAGTLAGETGLSREAILGQSLISPACGTGTLSPAAATRCFELTAEVSAWLRERS